MKKNKMSFLVIELLLFLLALFFMQKIFAQDVPEKRVAVILPESGDKRWDSLIKGMKQSAKMNGLHLIICNTDEIGNAEDEKEVVKEQLHNNVDAFIVCPAPGSETKEMLKRTCSDIPVMLITEDIYIGEKQAESGFPVIQPDHYEMGKELGEQLEKGEKKIGIVAGWKESEATRDSLEGLTDALKGTGSQIVWHCYREKGEDICDQINRKETVDVLMILDSGALDEIGEQAEDGLYCGAEVYGIGSSVKSIALLDYGRIQGLVAPDGYEMGYESIEEIAKKLNYRVYEIKSHETELKVIHKEDLFSGDDMERFLYSYE